MDLLLAVATISRKRAALRLGIIIDIVDDKIGIKVHYVDENAFVKDGVFGPERHTEEFWCCLDSFAGVPTLCDVFRIAASIDVCFIGVFEVDGLEHIVNGEVKGGLMMLLELRASKMCGKGREE